MSLWLYPYINLHPCIHFNQCTHLHFIIPLQLLICPFLSFYSLTCFCPLCTCTHLHHQRGVGRKDGSECLFVPFHLLSPISFTHFCLLSPHSHLHLFMLLEGCWGRIEGGWCVIFGSECHLWPTSIIAPTYICSCPCACSWPCVHLHLMSTLAHL